MDEKFDTGGEPPARSVSIERVAPLQDSAHVDRACSTVEFLHQKTPGFMSPDLRLPNDLNLNSVD